MTTPPKDTTERDELAKALLIAIITVDYEQPYAKASGEAFDYADAYMAEKGRRNG